MADEALPSRSLSGHTDSINAVAAGTPTSDVFESTVLTGSDDGTARIWDSRAADSSASVFTAPATKSGRHRAVHAVSYSTPLLYRPLPTWGPHLPASTPTSVFISSGASVWEFDARRPDQGPLFSFPACADDVAAIVPMPFGSRGVAFADDSGAASVYTRAPALAAAGRSDACGAAPPLSQSLAAPLPLWALADRWDAHPDGLASGAAWWPAARRLVSCGTDRTLYFRACPGAGASAGASASGISSNGGSDVSSLDVSLPVTENDDAARSVTMNPPMLAALVLVPPPLPPRGLARIAALAGAPADAETDPDAPGGLLVAAAHTGALLLFGLQNPRQPASSPQEAQRSAGRAGAAALPAPVSLGSLLGHSHAVAAVEVPPALSSSSRSSTNVSGAGGRGAWRRRGFPDALVSAGLDKVLVLWSGLAEVFSDAWGYGDEEDAGEGLGDGSSDRRGGRNGDGSGGDGNGDNTEDDDVDEEEDEDDDEDFDWWSPSAAAAAPAVTPTRAPRRARLCRSPARAPSSAFADGPWAALDDSRAAEFDVALMRVRAPLPERPNALASDARGWAWVADAGAELRGYALIRE